MSFLHAACRIALSFAAAVALFIGFSVAGPGEAAAQLTGGLEGRVIHHLFSVTAPDGADKVVAEAWTVRKTGILYVRGAPDPAMLRLPLTLSSRAVAEVPDNARALHPQKSVLDSPGWLKAGHLWARTQDGVADTGLKLIVEPFCANRCEVVAVEQYHLPGSEGMDGGRVKLVDVDRFPLEVGDRITVYAPR